MQQPMPVYYEDKSLADEMLSGSKAAFDKIYRKYAPALLGYILKTANDRQLSDHILEKAMTEIWERRSK
jgi:DNA-directed RNA polymerase specialized sigma24 family protein